MCVCACGHVACVYACVHVCVLACGMCVCGVCVCMCVCVSACGCSCMRVCVCVYVWVCMYASVCGCVGSYIVKCHPALILHTTITTILQIHMYRLVASAQIFVNFMLL